MIDPASPYAGTDIYCDEIIPGHRPVEIVAETDQVLAFHHTRPYWPTHVVVIPKQHVPSLLELVEQPALFQAIMTVVADVSKKVLAETGAVAVTTNLGSYQDSKHVHWHIHAGQPLNDQA